MNAGDILSDDDMAEIALLAGGAEADACARQQVADWQEPADPDYDLDAEPFAECPACGEINYPTGQLGNRVHVNCRACGMWFSHEAE